MDSVEISLQVIILSPKSDKKISETNKIIFYFMVYTFYASNKTSTKNLCQKD